MNAFSSLSFVLGYIGQALYGLYTYVVDFGWPLEGLQNWLYNFSRWFQNLADDCHTLAVWYENLIDQILSVLSWDSIRGLILEWLPGLPAVLDWFAAWPGLVAGEISEWWQTAQAVVLTWIAAARADIEARLSSFLSLDVFLLWWGHVGTTFDDWWASARAGVEAGFETVVAPVRDKVNEHAGAIELLTSPGDTALRWLLDRIETALARMW